ncbi:hypothetical protein V1511DRAFT_227587 [Dipodascopsis uninucleata]
MGTCYLEDLPQEIIQLVAKYLSDRCLCALLQSSKTINLKVDKSKYFWRARFLQHFDNPKFFEKSSADVHEVLVTDIVNVKDLERDYDFRHHYIHRVKMLAYRFYAPDDVEYARALLAEHKQKNYSNFEGANVVQEYMFHLPLTPAKEGHNKTELREKFDLVKSLLIPALGFPGIAPRPLDPIYRIVYDSPRHPLFHPDTGLPQLHVVSALVTFWQMMNVHSGLGPITTGMDEIEPLRYINRRTDPSSEDFSTANRNKRRMRRRRENDSIFSRTLAPAFQDNSLAFDFELEVNSETGEPDISSILASNGLTDIVNGYHRHRRSRSNSVDLAVEDHIAGNSEVDGPDDNESAWETDSSAGWSINGETGFENIFLGLYAFFNYQDFELFRLVPTSSEMRRSIIGDIVDWQINIPNEISGPISLRVSGTSHHLRGTTEQRRAIVEITPIEEPILGVLGWAKFCMYCLEFEVGPREYEEQRWIHKAVMLPGCKAVLGRWHDGYDSDTERAVEGPIVWIRR